MNYLVTTKNTIKTSLQKSLSFSAILFFVFFYLLFFGVTSSYAQVINADLSTAKGQDGTTIFNAQNDEPFDVYAIVQFSSLKGLQANQSLPAVLKIPPGRSANVLTLSPQTNAQTISYKLKYSFVYTDPNKNKPSDYLYYFPFEHGTKQTITQGWNGAFSHRGQNKYAVDFDLVAGEKVYAARDGTVIALKEDSRVGGATERYNKSANYVLVLHNDNTIANYVHLQYGGAEVNLGDRVEVGDLIGRSGSTGFASGPHLHFDVRISSIDKGVESIPFSFRDKDGNPVQPRTNYSYYGRFPDGADFTEIHGKDIRAELYVDYLADLPLYNGAAIKQNTLHLRKETYDDVIVLFMSNTFSQDIEATVNLILTNAKASTALPIVVKIPRNREVFLGIVRVVNMQRNIAIRTKISYVFF